VSRNTRINTLRIAAAALLTGFAWFQEQWLLLVPAAILAYQAYRRLTCVFCEAGFCDEESGKEKS